MSNFFVWGQRYVMSGTFDCWIIYLSGLQYLTNYIMETLFLNYVKHMFSALHCNVYVFIHT